MTRQLVLQQMQEQQAERERLAQAAVNAPPPAEPSAEEKLLRRAEAGEVTAQLQLAKNLRESHKLDASAQWLAKAAASGHPEGEFQLGNCYLKGLGLAQDYSQAKHWYTMALGHGHKHAQQALDWIAAQRAQVLRKLGPLQAQADAGDAQAQYLFGQRNGDDSLQDFPTAARYFLMAAVQGHAGAQFALFTVYGQGQGVERNPQQALQWLMSAAARKHVDAVRLFMRRYADREIDEQQFPQAATLFADNHFLYPEFLDPHAPPPSMARLQNAAFQGELPSLYWLGLAYCNGEGVALDLERGLKMLQKAVDRNYPAAQEEMARRYGVGDGVERDLDRGSNLALKALHQGRAEARFMLVTLFQMTPDEVERRMHAVG